MTTATPSPDQTEIPMTSGMARPGSPKNAEDAPNQPHTLAAGPPEGLKIRLKTSPMIVTPRIVGRKTTARAKFLPRNRWLSSTAMNKAMTFCNRVTETANTSVFFSALRL